MILTKEIIKESIEALVDIDKCNPNSRFYIYENNIKVHNCSVENRKLTCKELYSYEPQNSNIEQLFTYELDIIDISLTYDEYIDQQVDSIFALYCHYIYEYPDEELYEELSKELNPFKLPDNFASAYYHHILRYIDPYSKRIDVFNETHVRENKINFILNE